jgi:hypothetical protein
MTSIPPESDKLLVDSQVKDTFKVRQSERPQDGLGRTA